MHRLLLGLVLAALSLTADDNLTRLQIVVTSESGKPVDRADVVVKFVQGRSKVKFGAKIRKSWEMRTSQEGIAKVPSLPQGKILIQVIAKNYQTFGETFDVQDPEKTIEIKLKPPQVQYSAHDPLPPAK